MIRQNELLSFLETISSTVLNELRPDLGSDHAKRSADFLIQVVDRLVAQLRDGERIAADKLAGWQGLRAELSARADMAAAASPDGGSLEKLEGELALLQQQLQKPECFAQMSKGFEDPGSAAAQWFRYAIRELHVLMEAIEDSVQPQAAKTVAENKPSVEPGELAKKLGAYLRRKFPQLPEDPVTALRIAPGGSTKLTAVFSLCPNPVLPQQLVLRQDVALNMTGTLVTGEYPIVERLFKLGLRVPQPILVEQDASTLGGAFMIMTEITDATSAGTYFAKDRALQPRMIGPQFGREAAAELAKLHRSTAVPAGDSGVLAAARQETIESAHRRWMSMNRPPNSLMIDIGFAWLKSHPLDVERPRCLIHGDYGVHNMMARDGQLAAVIDWELAQEDDPAIDLAECRMMMVEDTLPWDEFVAAYLAAGGDPHACDPKAVAYYCVWMYVVKFGLMLSEARACYIGGARTDSLTASVASHSMDRILQYAARALTMAVGGESRTTGPDRAILP